MKKFALFVASLIFSLSCLAQVPEKEQAAIVATVDTMLASLKAGDSETAFALHAPVIQRQFETAVGFTDHLRKNFPVLPDHTSAVVVDVDVHQGTVIAATVVDYDGAIWLVMFSMEISQGGAWLISGCGIQRTTSKGV